MADPARSKAAQVCASCKQRKRRCDKLLPSCSMCTKLLLKCDYDYSPAGSIRWEETFPTPTTNSPNSSSGSNRSMSQLLASSNLLASFPPGLSSSSVGFEGDVASQVLEILNAHGEDPSSVMLKYFTTVDTWLPVLSQKEIEKRLETIVPNPSVDLATLLLCMYLIVQTPDAGRNMQDLVYYDARALVSMQMSSGKTTIEIIQAGLLLSVYEQCHGMTQAAQITMAGCSTLALKRIGIFRKTGNEDLQNTELGRVWWGLVIVDRYMNLGVAAEDIHLATGQPSHRRFPLELPMDNEAVTEIPSAAHTPSGVRFVPHKLRASSQTTRLGPFCRTAEAARLLGETLELVSGSAYNNFINWNQSNSLDDSLQQLAMSLLYQAVNGWEECCGAIGICFSALLTLHKRIWELKNEGAIDLNNDTLKATMAIRSATRIVIDVSRKFHMDLAFINLHALPPPATYCVYLAAMLHIQFAGQGFMAPEWKADMECMKSTLNHFGKRWYIGQQYLAQIDIAIADEMKSRSPKSIST